LPFKLDTTKYSFKMDVTIHLKLKKEMTLRPRLLDQALRVNLPATSIKFKKLTARYQVAVEKLDDYEQAHGCGTPLKSECRKRAGRTDLCGQPHQDGPGSNHRTSGPIVWSGWLADSCTEVAEEALTGSYARSCDGENKQGVAPSASRPTQQTEQHIFKPSVSWQDKASSKIDGAHQVQDKLLADGDDNGSSPSDDANHLQRYPKQDKREEEKEEDKWFSEGFWLRMDIANIYAKQSFGLDVDIGLAQQYGKRLLEVRDKYDAYLRAVGRGGVSREYQDEIVVATRMVGEMVKVANGGEEGEFIKLATTQVPEQVAIEARRRKEKERLEKRMRGDNSSPAKMELNDQGGQVVCKDEEGEEVGVEENKMEEETPTECRPEVAKVVPDVMTQTTEERGDVGENVQVAQGYADEEKDSEETKEETPDEEGKDKTGATLQEESWSRGSVQNKATEGEMQAESPLSTKAEENIGEDEDEKVTAAEEGDKSLDQKEQGCKRPRSQWKKRAKRIRGRPLVDVVAQIDKEVPQQGMVVAAYKGPPKEMSLDKRQEWEVRQRARRRGPDSSQLGTSASP
jgi:hypothetical protein